MLAELVKAGKLPPVAQRIPQEPLVIKPLNEIGKYGGTWRRGFLGPGDWRERQPPQRLRQAAVLGLHRHQDRAERGQVVGAKRRRQDDPRCILRKGMKWSDGAPFTADDFVFWFEDIYSNKDLVPTPIADMAAGGKPGQVVKIDETTVEFQFDDPHFLFVDLLAGDTLIGGGQSVRQSQGVTYGAYAPEHYLKQFLPKYSLGGGGQREGQGRGLRELGASMLHFKKDWSLNPELPTIGPWKTVRPINTPTWVLERNPYLLGGRHRRQPAALHRSRDAHARRGLSR